MRVTENQLLTQATAAVSEARSRAARATEVMSSGRRVERPSHDPTGWAEGARAAARQIASGERGSAIAHAQTALAQSEDALSTIGTNLTRASEIALQAANGTLQPADRLALVPLLQGLRDANLAAANRPGADGEYLFSGSRGDVKPFDSAGNYVGDAVSRTIESAEGAHLASTLPGSTLTAAGGGAGAVDVLRSIDVLITAVSTGDIAGMQSANATLRDAIGQVANARAQVGARRSALISADEARTAFEVRLEETLANAVEADPVEAASELARSAAGLEAARAVAQEIVALVRSSR